MQHYKITISGSGTQAQILQALHELVVKVQYLEPETLTEASEENHILCIEVTEE